MPTIKNLTRQVVLLRLNSGAEINVAPGAALADVSQSEVRNNKVLERLAARQIISLEGDKPAKGAAREPAPAAVTAEDKRDADPPARETPEPKRPRR